MRGRQDSWPKMRWPNALHLDLPGAACECILGSSTFPLCCSHSEDRATRSQEFAVSKRFCSRFWSEARCALAATGCSPFRASSDQNGWTNRWMSVEKNSRSHGTFKWISADITEFMQNVLSSWITFLILMEYPEALVHRPTISPKFAQASSPLFFVSQVSSRRSSEFKLLLVQTDWTTKRRKSWNMLEQGDQLEISCEVVAT